MQGTKGDASQTTYSQSLEGQLGGSLHPELFSGPLRSPSLPKDTCVWRSLRLAGSLAEMNSHKTPAKFPS